MFEVCLSIVVGHSQLICHTLLVQSSVYYLIVSATAPSLKLSANFCRVFLVIFRYTAGTRVSTVVAYSDFTSRSPDYVLSKSPFLVASLVTSRWFLHMCVGVKEIAHCSCAISR